MKRLTKKQKAAYPEFIALIDICADKRKIFKGAKGYIEPGYYIRAMEEKDILSAMRRAEKAISTMGYAMYLVDILGKSGREDEVGAPIYEIKIRTRIHLSEWDKDADGNPKAMSANWHFCDREHCESNDCEFKWDGREDRYGYLEWISKQPA